MDAVMHFCFKFKTATMLSVLLFIFATKKCAEGSPDLATMNSEQLIRHWGYEPETHTVTTEDGYILKQHRIGHGKGRPFILQHALLGASDAYILRGPKKDLAFLLAESGYDVWLMNVRGNVYGRQHIRMSPNNEKFWDFSWHEMGYYDMPAIIDHILNVTGHSKVMYVGHSMGTTISYVLGSTKPEYNDKLALVFSWAPVAFISHMPIGHWLRPFANIANGFGMELRKQGIHGVLPRLTWLSRVSAGFCDQRSFQAICLLIVSVVVGFDIQQNDPELLPQFVSHSLAGTSFKTLEHYAQSLLLGGFRMYNYGKKKNLKVYGKESPPAYNLSLITAPVALYYGSNDNLNSVQDVERLARMLPNLVGKFRVPHKDFNHIDYISARDSKQLVYDSMFEIMKKNGLAE